MTADREQRIAVLQHARRQRHRHEELASLSPHAPVPIDPEESFTLQESSRAEIVRMREAGKLRRVRFASAEDAVHAFMQDLGDLEQIGLWRFYGHERAGLEGDGFFTGPMEPLLLSSWLAAGNDGFLVITRDLVHGRLLDVVKDDPWEGSFVEIESW